MLSAVALRDRCRNLGRAADAPHAAGARRVSATRLRLPQAELSRKSNQLVRARIRQFESYMPSHAVDRHCRPASPPLGFLPSPVGSDKMRNLLAEYPAWFEPDEVQILVGAFDKAWETVQAIGVVYAEAKAEAVRTILAKHNY